MEPHHQILFSVIIQDIPILVGILIHCREFIQSILGSID